MVKIISRILWVVIISVAFVIITSIYKFIDQSGYKYEIKVDETRIYFTNEYKLVDNCLYFKNKDDNQETTVCGTFSIKNK